MLEKGSHKVLENQSACADVILNVSRGPSVELSVTFGGCSLSYEIQYFVRSWVQVCEKAILSTLQQHPTLISFVE